MFIRVIQRQNEQNKQIFQCTYSFQANTRFMLCAVVALAGCSNDETSQTGELQDKVMGTASTVTFSTESSATQTTTMTRTSINNFQSKVVFSKSKKRPSLYSKMSTEMVFFYWSVSNCKIVKMIIAFWHALLFLLLVFDTINITQYSTPNTPPPSFKSPSSLWLKLLDFLVINPYLCSWKNK